MNKMYDITASIAGLYVICVSKQGSSEPRIIVGEIGLAAVPRSRLGAGNSIVTDCELQLGVHLLL